MANLHWSAALYAAAEAFDGGARSFPMASEAEIGRKHGYEPPNEDYEKLFFCQASIPRSQRDPGARPHSAGWLIPSPDDASVCKPVFVAHSVLSAIWLLRETLADDALPNDGWDRLVCAAESLAEDSMVGPPSAQKPSASPLARRNKRPAPTAQASSPKRARTEAVESPAASQQAEEPVEEQRTITTVTNNNRDAERKRIKAYEAAQVERSLDLGLVAPDKKAVDDERGAYAAVPVKDKAIIAWLFKQDAVDKHQKKTDFYNAVKSPYLKARDFWPRRARSGARRPRSTLLTSYRSGESRAACSAMAHLKASPRRRCVCESPASILLSRLAWMACSAVPGTAARSTKRWSNQCISSTGGRKRS